MCTFKTLGLIDTFKNLHNTINFTHLRSRIDRIYITALFHPKIISIQHIESFSDHKLVFLDINLDKFKPWGKYYWKLNNSLLENEFYKQEILNLIQEYNDTKMLNTPHQNWTNFKQKVQKTSKKFSSFLSAIRKNEILACQHLKRQNLSEELHENIKEKEEELKNYQNSGNLVRVKNKTLNKIYSKGKELNRKQEFEKGISKFIFKIKTNNTEYAEKKDILNEIQNFYQNLYNSQNIPDTNIHKYLEDFTPPTLKDNQKKQHRILYNRKRN